MKNSKNKMVRKFSLIFFVQNTTFIDFYYFFYKLANCQGQAKGQKFWIMSKARNFGQNPETKYFGQSPGPRTLANFQGQEIWSKSRARNFGHNLEPDTFANV